MSENTERFELVYGNGGHGGPYPNRQEAYRAAQRLLLGSRTEQVIYLVPCSSPHFTRIHAVDEVRRLPD